MQSHCPYFKLDIENCSMGYPRSQERLDLAHSTTFLPLAYCLSYHPSPCALSPFQSKIPGPTLHLFQPLETPLAAYPAPIQVFVTEWLEFLILVKPLLSIPWGFGVPCSLAIRSSFGFFSLSAAYTGTGNQEPGKGPWRWSILFNEQSSEQASKPPFGPNWGFLLGIKS